MPKWHDDWIEPEDQKRGIEGGAPDASHVPAPTAAGLEPQLLLATGVAAADLPLQAWSATKALHTMWATWQSRSTIAFACPELEARYQVYDATTVKFLTWFGPALTLGLYAVLRLQVYGKGAPYRNLLPPLSLPLLFHLLPAAAVLTLLLLAPAWYRRHRRAISFAFGACFTLAFQDVRKVQLWLRLVDPGEHGSLLARLQGFTAENVYLSIMWMCVSGNPTGPLFDIVLLVGLLVRAVGGNAEICASPLWPAHSVTMSPGATAVAKSVTAGLLEVVFPLFRVKIGRLMTCPGALAFWQVAGSWVALLVSGILEVSRRRAFLRTHAAQSWLGPEMADSGLRWPFLSAVMCERLVPALVWLTLAHIAALAVVLEGSAKEAFG